MSTRVHPKVKAAGLAGALTVALAEVGGQIGFHPSDPAFWPAITVIVSYVAGWRA